MVYRSGKSSAPQFHFGGGGIVGENQPEQDVTFVLMHNGGFELTAGGTCAAVVGMKDCLTTKGYMDPRNNSGSWINCPLITWCNSNYREAFPTTFKALFKQFKVTTAATFGTSTVVTDDYFALFAEKEVFGTTINAINGTEDNLFQIELYKTVANRKKTANGSAAAWWLRSKSDGDFDYCNVNSVGNAGQQSALYERGISPFGVI